MNLFSGRKPVRGREQGISGKNRNIDVKEPENTTQEEDVLLEQINELKKKAESLQRVLAVREQRAEELGQIISDREGKVKELDVAIESRRKAVDQLTVDVTVQVQEMIQALDKQTELLKLLDCRQKQSDENVQQQQGELKAALGELSEKLDNLKFDFGDRIHTENVKCYRNIKSLFTELDGKLADTELGADSLGKIRKSFKGWKFFSFFAFADFILIIVYILYSMGMF